jgi:large subunit ribosomal protein L4
MASFLAAIGVPSGTLIVISGRDRNVELAARNLPRVLVLPVEGINVYDILRHRNLVVSQDALAAIEARLG